MVSFGILGPIELCDGERRLPVGGPRQQRLLAFLVLHANGAVSADELIDGLWAEQDRAGAHKRLQVAVGRLRKALPGTAGGDPRLRTVSGGYLLTVAAGELDADVFRARAQERAGGRLSRATPRARRMFCARRWRCGAGRRWRRWPMRSSRRPRSGVWTSCG